MNLSLKELGVFIIAGIMIALYIVHVSPFVRSSVFNMVEG
jgi:hypothetical protein